MAKYVIRAYTDKGELGYIAVDPKIVAEFRPVAEEVYSSLKLNIPAADPTFNVDMTRDRGVLILNGHPNNPNAGEGRHNYFIVVPHSPYNQSVLPEYRPLEEADFEDIQMLNHLLEQVPIDLEKQLKTAAHFTETETKSMTFVSAFSEDQTSTQQHARELGIRVVKGGESPVPPSPKGKPPKGNGGPTG